MTAPRSASSARWRRWRSSSPSSPAPWWWSKPRSRVCASTAIRSCWRPPSSSPSSPSSARNWCEHAGRPSRSARRVDLQPDGDREPDARFRDARLALAQQLSLRLRRRILGDRGAVGCRRLLRPLSRTLSDRRAHRVVPRPAAALPSLAHHRPAQCHARDPRNPAAELGAGGRRARGRFRAGRGLPRRPVARSRRHRRRAGAHRHAVDETDRLPDAGGAARGAEPNSRPAGAGERHLPRRADPGAGHAAA